MPYLAWPLVLAGMSSAGSDLPMILYWLRSLSLMLLEIVGIGELAVDLHLLQDLAVADRAAGGLVDHAAVLRAAVGQLGAEHFRARFDQRDAAGGASACDAVELGGDAAAVDGVGEPVDARSSPRFPAACPGARLPSCTSSSSAMTCARPVPICWPISALTMCIVVLPSGVMVNQIDGREARRSRRRLSRSPLATQPRQADAQETAAGDQRSSAPGIRGVSRLVRCLG